MSSNVAQQTPAGEARGPSSPEALGHGDPIAWRRLLAEHYDTVFGYAFAATGNASDAADVASAVFTDAVREVRRFKGTPLPALLRLARRRAARVARTRKRGGGDPHDAAPVRTPLPGILGLEPEQAAVVALRLVERRPVSEVARVLRCDERKVLTIQERALRSIAGRMEREQ